MRRIAIQHADAAQTMDGSVAALRQQFQQQPAGVQACTLDRVCSLLRDERARKPVVPSYLWRVAKAVYGVEVERV